MKKDYNYIASVEKAIAEKYGKCAAQDFRGSWDEESEKDYLGQIRKKNEIKNRDNFKKEETLVGDIRITRRAKEEEEASRICPVCKTYSFSMKDELYMNRFQCCHKCFYDFVDGQQNRWADDWRPNTDQLKAALKRRKIDG